MMMNISMTTTTVNMLTTKTTTKDNHNKDKHNKVGRKERGKIALVLLFAHFERWSGPLFVGFFTQK